jgi:hypothetical protein
VSAYARAPLAFAFAFARILLPGGAAARTIPGMKKTASVAACILLGSSLLLGCAEHEGASADVAMAPPPPPPPPPVGVQVGVQAQVQGDAPPADGQAEMAPPPDETAEPEEVVATSEPPEPVYEEQTDMPSPGMVWVGGYWGWTGNDWAWYYGGWQPAPAGRIYVEPYYERVDDHVVYVRGYWGVTGEEPRYYGGERIVFVAPPRPVGYVRGQYTVVVRSGGLPPGQRGHYGPRPSGPVKKRPMPIARAPRPRGGRGGGQHVEPGRGEGRGEPSRGEPGRVEAEPRAKPEARPAPQPERKAPPPRQSPKPRKK